MDFLDVDDRTAFAAAGVADAVLLIVLAIIARADRGTKMDIFGCAECEQEEAGAAIDRPGITSINPGVCPRCAIPPPQPD